MKTFLRISCFVLFAVILLSCETSHYFMVEIQKPAEISFMPPSPRIVVVDNAVTQPSDIGVDCYNGFKELTGYTLQKDTIHQIFTDILGQSLDNTHYFEEVLVYNTPLRTDNEYLAIQTISPEKADEILEDAGADALISVERLLFKNTLNLVGRDFKHFNTDYSALFSIHFRKKEKPVSSFSIENSIQFKDFIDNDSLLIFQEIPQHLLRMSALQISEELAQRLTPHWEQSERVIYGGEDALMKTAYAFAKKEKWEEAISIWEDIYLNSKNNKRKGKAAINIALSKELKDNFISAGEWAQNALNCYALEKPESISKELEFATQYKKILEDRAIHEITLNHQVR